MKVDYKNNLKVSMKASATFIIILIIIGRQKFLEIISLYNINPIIYILIQFVGLTMLIFITGSILDAIKKPINSNPKKLCPECGKIIKSEFCDCRDILKNENKIR